MKSNDEKLEVLYDLAELYLNTKENSYFNINDGIADEGDYDSMNFLMLLALTSESLRDTNLFSVDFDINIDAKNTFITSEYEKVIKSKKSKINQGKMILEDAELYYDKIYGVLDTEQVHKLFEEHWNKRFHI